MKSVLSFGQHVGGACVLMLVLVGTSTAQEAKHFEPIEFHRFPATLATAQETPAMMQAVAFSADGKWLASGDDAGRIVIRESGAEAIHQTCLAENNSPVGKLQFLKQGERLASLHVDGKIHLWSTRDGKHLQSLPASRYLSIASIPASETLLTVTDEPALQAWTVAGASDLPLKMTSSTALDAPFVMLSISRAGNRMVLADATGWQVWDANSMKKKLAAKLPAANMTAVRMSPDGRTFATGDADGKVRVRDAASGGLLFSWQRHPNQVTSLAYSSTGKTLVSSCMKNRFRVWDLTLGEPTNDRAIALPTIHALEFSPDDRHLAAVGSSGGVLYLIARRMTAEIAAVMKPRMWNSKAVFAVVVPPGKSEAVVLGKNSTPQLIDLESGEVTAGKKLAPSERLHRAAISRDGTLATYAYPTGVISVYDAVAGERLHLKHFEGRPTALAFSPDARRLAISFADKLIVIDCESGEVAMQMDTVEPLRVIHSVAWSADGTAFYLLGPDLEAADRAFTVAKWSMETGELLKTTTSSEIIGVIGISDDGQRLVTGGISGLVCVFDADLNRLNQFECGGRGGLHAFKVVDQQHLLVGTYKGSVLLVDMISGEERTRFEPLPPEKGMPVRAIDIDQDRRHMIAAGGYDGDETIRIYALNDLLK